MKRVERHIIINDKDIKDLCFKSKNLYNYVNYQIRQHFFKTRKILSEYENSFSYDVNQFDIHNEKETKECIKNDIENGIIEDRYEDTEPLIVKYDISNIIDSLSLTLEQYHYKLK